MIYLIGKIVLSLLASLGIGFGMAWALQMHLAARLREQLNSVIFETKSRIPQLESEITNRDQVIDGLREDLAKKPKEAPVNNQAGSKEQEKQIDELRQQVIDLETELKAARGVVDNDSVLEFAEEDRVHTEEPELMSDDEFLADIQDIFDEPGSESEPSSSTDTAQSSDQSSTPSSESPSEQVSEEAVHQSLEDELQSELESWDDSTLEDKKPATVAGDNEVSQESGDVDALRSEVESLTEARKELNDLVDSQAKEMSSMRQQRELQEKSLGVLNQQLELARMANERILRELREVKDSSTEKNPQPRSASGS